jgi:hypothetical protein
MSSSLDNLFQDYNNCEALYQQQVAYYKQQLEAILQAWHQHTHGSQSASLALYQFQLVCMPMVTEMNETSIKQEADALNISTALRQDITSAQNDYNSLVGLIQQGKSAASGMAVAKELASALAKVSQDLHHPGMTKIMGGTLDGGVSAIQNIQNYINDIRNQFFGGGVQRYTGVAHPSVAYTLFEFERMLSPDSPFVTYAVVTGYDKFSNFYHGPSWQGGRWDEQIIYRNAYSLAPGASYPHMYSNLKSIMKITGGTNNTVLQAVTSDFTSMNQSVSGISSQIQAQMNYLNQSLQQYYSIYKSIFDSFSNYMSYIIQKSGP